MATLKDALDIVNKLSDEDKDKLKSMILSSTTKALDMEEFMDKERFSNGRVCPHCGATHVVRHGHNNNGKQRFRCMECRRTFSVTTASIVSGTQKDISTWEKYIDCMMNGYSIRKSADIDDAINSYFQGRITLGELYEQILIPKESWQLLIHRQYIANELRWVRLFNEKGDGVNADEIAG